MSSESLNMKIVWWGFLGLFVVSFNSFGQHGHLNAGAVGQTQNDKLIWANGEAFAAESFVRTMIFTNGGRFANSYSQNISLTSLPRTTNNGGPVANAPALGSFVLAEIVSVAGPEGGAFQFWDTNSPDGVPAFTIPSGTSNGTFRYDLSDKTKGAGVAAGDPFGHIHSRRFGITKPGRYTVGFRAIDVSTNGENGGPVHAPSDVLPIKFESVTTLAAVGKVGNLVSLTFKAEEDYHYAVEYIDDLQRTNNTWTASPVSVTHSNAYLTLPISTESNSRRYYRLKVEHDAH